MVSALNGLFDFTAAETACADSNTLGRSVNHGANPLEVGIERAFGLIVGVTDVMTRLVFF